MPSFAITEDLDPRLTPARADLAASWLKDHVKAARYVEPTRQQVIIPVVNMHRSPDEAEAIETQLIYGEPIDVFETKDGWAWVQATRDGYVGYVRDDTIGFIKGDASATHRIANIGSFIYPTSSYKTIPQMQLSYGSLVRVEKEKEGLSAVAGGGFVPTAHLAPLEFHAEDPVAEAFRFLGVPYLWGGKSHIGLDCSALVQLVLQACNIKCPRDSDLQEKMVGKPIKREQVQSGDLVFFRGHVGLMVDENTMIHANDRAMAVSIDDLDEYIRWRSKEGKTPVKMFKRV